MPLIGNFHQLPKKDHWQLHQEWREKYGPIVTVRMGMNTMIMINHYAIANELLQKVSGHLQLSTKDAVFEQISHEQPATDHAALWPAVEASPSASYDAPEFDYYARLSPSTRPGESPIHEGVALHPIR